MGPERLARTPTASSFRTTDPLGDRHGKEFSNCLTVHSCGGVLVLVDASTEWVVSVRTPSQALVAPFLRSFHPVR